MHRHKDFSKAAKMRFENLLNASFLSILRDNRISEAIVQFLVILAVLETKRFLTPSFSNTSDTQIERSTEDGLQLQSMLLSNLSQRNYM
jgi:hypothetical protein